MNLDEHYRRIAAANPRPRSMKDVMVNGETIHSRNFGAYRSNTLRDDPFGTDNLATFGVKLAWKHVCETCGAQTDERCRSVIKGVKGKEMRSSVHNKRYVVGKLAHKRKEA